MKECQRVVGLPPTGRIGLSGGETVGLEEEALEVAAVLSLVV